MVSPNDIHNKQELDATCTVCHIPNGEHSFKELLACKSAIETQYEKLVQIVRIETEKINERLQWIKSK